VYRKRKKKRKNESERAIERRRGGEGELGEERMKK
jgi:hypothetical protein